MGWARRLRRELGATPISGEQLAQFRYLLLHVGTADDGARLELLEPRSEGFLTRFLDARGEGPHHLTVVVPDLRATVAQARALGLTVVGEESRRRYRDRSCPARRGDAPPMTREDRTATADF